MQYPSIRDLKTGGKRIFLRADLNVPIEDGKILDDTRIRSVLRTIRYLIEQGSPVVLASHLGRPEGRIVPDYSMKPIAEKLKEILTETRILFARDCVGKRVEAMAAGLGPGELLVLENLRFHPEETANEPGFAKKLAVLGDIYVNDAFGTSHREHSSMVGVPEILGGGYVGFLVEKELRVFGELIRHPRKPYTVILGGIKVSDKVAVIENVLPKLDNLIVGGAMAFTFYKAMDLETGTSIVEEDTIQTAKDIIQAAEERGVNLILPVDIVCAPSRDHGDEAVVRRFDDLPADMAGFDIGPESIELFRRTMLKSKTIVWNGPMGLFEIRPFDVGTRQLAAFMADATSYGAIAVVGGGDSMRAVREAGVAEQITHVSTGGGASLKLLQGEELPALEHLRIDGVKPFVGANWKMNGSLSMGIEYLTLLDDGNVNYFGADVVLFAPFTLLSAFAPLAERAGIHLGAQDIFWEEKGAYTGEISATMLKEAGCSWFLAGHSERRHILGETDEIVRKKVKAGLAAELSCVLCVGELLEQREAGKTEEIIRGQLESALSGIEDADPYNLVIAYEPVWAIGTGKTATPDEVQRIHGLIRQWVAEILDKEFAGEVGIIYGGSVKPSNAAEVMSGKDINGALVGGASLKADSFIEIVAECH
ncbi:MAG: triose-phosphate isomerase [Candidatus Sabulitectum sp.]|nr:triose-phosphate isomerase [Candidatus Sabulitectum sp.]